ncbi:MAG: hypothetical protein ISS71_04530 [Phycisphaerae bacterium]|nr:hypothetical protein [Phycisphaerae bacterium]
MKNLVKLSIVLLLIGSFVGLAWANKAHKDYDGTTDYCIMISPNTVVLSSPCEVISVHSNIPYDIVDALTITLNSIDPISTGADDCGDLVVKVLIDDLDLEAGQVTLTLSGLLNDGTEIAVDETITVKE